MRYVGALICTLASGLMFYLSQGTHDVWWQAWFAPLPILWLAYGSVRTAIAAACAFLAFASGQLYMVECYWGQLPLSFLILWLLASGALFAAAILAARLVWRRLSPYAALFAFPVFWTAIEYLASQVSPHGTFGAIAYSQASFPPALQVASLFGLAAITFMLCLFANGLALLARRAKAPAALGIGLAALGLFFGFVRLSEPQPAPLRVAALADQQAWLAGLRRHGPAASEAMAEEYARAAHDDAARGARLIVTPETSITFTPAWREKVVAPLSRVAKMSNVTLVTGSLGLKPSRNLAMTYMPDGGVRQYDKRHLLHPFEDEFTAGNEPGLIGRGRAVAICKDMDFPATLRTDAANAEAVNNGIRIMAVPANDFVKDGWIHARMAVLRGVENGFAIVRSAFKGLETVSDAEGRVIARADTNRPGLTQIIADIAPGPGPTLYTRIGDVFCWFMLALAAAFLGLSLRSR